MAAVTSNHVGDLDQLAEPTPSFTAVNGSASPAPPVKPRPDQEPHREAAEAPNHRPLLPNNQHETPSPATLRQEQPNNDGEYERQEKRLSPVAAAQIQTQVQNPKPPAPAPIPIAPMEHPSSRATQQADPNDPRSQFPNGHSRTPSIQQPPVAVMSPQAQKRKRSYEGEPDRRQDYDHQANSVYPITAPMNGPPPSPGGQRMHDMDNGHPRDRQGYSPRQTYPPPQGSYPPPPQDTYAAPPRMRDSPPEIYPRPERHQLVRNEYDQPVDPSIAPAPPRPYYSDPQEAHLANALQRENRGYDSIPPRENAYGTPEDDDDPHAQYGAYGDNRNSQELDRKRRKRVFSNRTKTGCMTCRRRKKKCDEQHPECNNCLRGGFVCEGYTMRNTWQKPANAKAPIPLQSKNGYPPPQGTPTRAPYPPPSRYNEVSPEYPGPPPQQMQHRPSYDQGDRGKPINVEDDRDGVYGRSSPPDSAQKSAYGKAVRPYPSNPPHVSKYQSENGHRGSIYEIPPDAPDQSMHPPPSVHRTNSTASQYSTAPPPSNHNNTPTNHNNVQAIAQAAATHPASLRPSPQRRSEQLSEREKMLKGLYYYPLTPALTQDRENCIAAIWRFNNATNPSHGASPEERCRLFRQILSLRPTPEPPGPNGDTPRPNMEMPFGSVGERVVVEAPFHCDYGYNITVGDDVLIGADCRISDTCSVTIGARCIFSPNVKLVCATYPIDPRRRMGSNGPALGRNIVIEEDCWIGSNVTILAGVRVGKSSTVGAGSLLHQDVPRFTVVAGNPAKVSRGIYDGNTDGQ